jgi:PucR C-terminal helix-turn-helix domain/GGDEF-like domain
MPTAPTDPAVRALSQALLPEAEQLATAMAARIRAEVALYADETLVSAAALAASCSDNIRYVLGNLAGTPVVQSEVPRATGRLRAESGVPYDAVLHAYRIGGRYIWELLVERADDDARDTLLLAAADIWTVTDELSAQVTDAYRATLAERVRRDGQVRAALLASLLDSPATDADRLREVVASLRLPLQGDLVVVSAECPTPGAEALAQVETSLRRQGVTSAWRLDVDHHDGVVVLRSRYRIDALLDELRRVAVGRVGVSPVFGRIEESHRALRQARLAGAAGSPGEVDVGRYEDRPIAVLLAAAPDLALDITRRTLAQVLDLPPADCRTLLDTARVWFDEAGATTAAADRLHLHRNSVRYRLRRLEELSGLDLTRPADLAALHLALEAARIFDLGGVSAPPTGR